MNSPSSSSKKREAHLETPSIVINISVLKHLADWPHVGEGGSSGRWVPVLHECKNTEET